MAALQNQGHPRRHHVAELLFMATLNNAVDGHLMALIRCKDSAEEQAHQDQHATCHLLTLLVVFQTVSDLSFCTPSSFQLTYLRL